MEHNDIKQQLKDVLKNEGLSWEKLAEVVGTGDRANLRRNMIGWMERTNNVLNKIGYRIAIVPDIEKNK